MCALCDAQEGGLHYPPSSMLVGWAYGYWAYSEYSGYAFTAEYRKDDRAYLIPNCELSMHIAKIMYDLTVLPKPGGNCR